MITVKVNSQCVKRAQGTAPLADRLPTPDFEAPAGETVTFAGRAL